jgi:imidazoleglycerol-phosphate dehydratase
MRLRASPGERALRVRLAPADVGRVSVVTGLPILDHLLGVLAEWGRFELEVETAPIGGTEEEVDAVGRALGRAVAELLGPDGERRHGSALVAADEALAAVVVEVSGRPFLAANVDLTAEHVGGLGTDLLSRLLRALAEEAGLTLHVRLIEGKDTRHVLDAIFKGLGLALAEAATERSR